MVRPISQLRIARVGLLLGLLLFISHTEANQNEVIDEQAQPLIEVAVVTVSATDFIKREDLSGRVSARRVVEVRPQVRGIIEKRLFTEGSLVNKGDVLYRINSDSYAADFIKANADLAVAEARLVNLKAIAERQQTLLGGNSVSRQEYDLAQANYQQGLAQVESNKAAANAAKVLLERTLVKAPISGRIGRSAKTEGALLSVDQAEALATIQQLDPIYVDVVQPSKQLLYYKRRLISGELKPGGNKVGLLLEDGQPYEHSGVLKFTEMDVNPNTGVVTLRAQFPNPDGLLLPGMYVQASIEQGIAAKVFLVPQQAVHYSSHNQAQAWVVNDQQTVELRVLDIIGSKKNQWIVQGGINHGDQIIIEGSMRVYSGLKVDPVPAVTEQLSAAVELPADDRGQ